MIKVARYRNTPYVVNMKSEGGIKRFEWMGAKGEKVDIKQITEDMVNHLLMSSRCFNDGELVIIQESPESIELVENIDDIENYTNNTHSRSQIEQILNKPANKMKAELDKITVLGEKNFVIEIAKEMGLDSSSKRSILAKWLGTPADILFEED